MEKSEKNRDLGDGRIAFPFRILLCTVVSAEKQATMWEGWELADMLTSVRAIFLPRSDIYYVTPRRNKKKLSIGDLAC